MASILPKLEIDPAQHLLVFQMNMPMRWGDMDAMGHVNNTIYFRYLEQLRISWFDHLKFSPNPQGQGPVIGNAYCHFIRELVYPGDLVLRQYRGEVGRASFESLATISRSDDPELIYAIGGARVVWVDYPQRKSLPLPAHALEAIHRPWAGDASRANPA